MAAPHQRDLFAVGAPSVDHAATASRIVLDDECWVDVTRRFVLGSDTAFDQLVDEVGWTQGRRRMFDRVVDDPRLSCWYRRGEPLPHPLLDEVRGHLVERYGVEFGSVGLNYYRDGRDSVAPHRDRELRDLDDDTLVAILTLGARRPFLLRPRGGGRSRDLSPGAGDLLVMGGRCQARWEHGVPKVRRVGPRISASWRWRRSAAPGHDVAPN